MDIFNEKLVEFSGGKCCALNSKKQFHAMNAHFCEKEKIWLNDAKHFSRVDFHLLIFGVLLYQRLYFHDITQILQSSIEPFSQSHAHIIHISHVLHKSWKQTQSFICHLGLIKWIRCTHINRHAHTHTQRNSCVCVFCVNSLIVSFSFDLGFFFLWKLAFLIDVFLYKYINLCYCENKKFIFI